MQSVQTAESVSSSSPSSSSSSSTSSSSQSSTLDKISTGMHNLKRDTETMIKQGINEVGLRYSLSLFL
jgi:hypothetical protein